MAGAGVQMEPVLNSRGTIVHVDRSGLAYVSPDGLDEILPFTFDKIYKYRGEQPEQIGLRKGAHVLFNADQGRVLIVKLSF